MTVDIIHVLLVTLISSNNQTKIEIGLLLLSTKRIHSMADSVSMCILIQSSCFHVSLPKNFSPQTVYAFHHRPHVTFQIR